ncbi:unnamed protein product [Adineta ricciae]|uniref:Uncharacterized protein n=1 Tax=Adineta ricciae TaxID=249248 RepID=A0A816DAT3_ADIRI|nr:unnamed protein product [Adineta ricciae]CAF1632295.1 unnamed protein product [Adineta ricciae]
MNDVGHTFSTLSNEKSIQTYQCIEGCGGPKTFVTINDKRIIVRQVDASHCCSAGARTDWSVFMRDIELLKVPRHQSTGLCLSSILFILTCKCQPCCSEFCGDAPKILEISGGFGTESIKFKRDEFEAVVDQLSSIILPLKN